MIFSILPVYFNWVCVFLRRNGHASWVAQAIVLSFFLNMRSLLWLLLWNSVVIVFFNKDLLLLPLFRIRCFSLFVFALELQLLFFLDVLLSRRFFNIEAFLPRTSLLFNLVFITGLCEQQLLLLKFRWFLELYALFRNELRLFCLFFNFQGIFVFVGLRWFVLLQLNDIYFTWGFYSYACLPFFTFLLLFSTFFRSLESSS